MGRKGGGGEEGDRDYVKEGEKEEVDGNGFREGRRKEGVRRWKRNDEEVVFSSLPDPPLLLCSPRVNTALPAPPCPPSIPFIPKRALDREKRSPLAARTTYTSLSRDPAIQCHFYFFLVASNPVYCNFFLASQFHFENYPHYSS